MTEAERIARIFESERDRLWALAYRMLGRVQDAEDVVQEAYVRWHHADHDAIQQPEAWLTTVCTRLSIDALRMAHRRREAYVGPWLPDPLVAGSREEAADPTELADSLSVGFLLLMERLSPLERAAFLLHDVFGYPYEEIARILDRSGAASRQLVSRARRHVRGGTARFRADPTRAQALVSGFLLAAREGDLQGLTAMLAEDVEVWSDSGGEVQAARNVLRGVDPVVRFLIGVAKKAGMLELHPTTVNHRPAVYLTRGQEVASLVTVELDENGRISHIFLMMAPSRLRRLAFRE